MTEKDLFENYKKDVYRTCFFMLHNDLDAEDVCQEVFISVFSHDWRQVEHLKTWLIRVTVNHCFNHFHSGIQKALDEGLGQSIQQSMTQDGVKLTIETAVVDDIRTVLVYSISSKQGFADYLNFSKMELKDSHNQIIEGSQSQIWDKASQTWQGVFQADWTPGALMENVQLSARTLHSYTGVERELNFNLSQDKSKDFAIHEDGIGLFKIKSFVQGDKMMLSSTVTYDQLEAKEWTYPSIGVYKDNVLIKNVGTSVMGTPGEQGEFNSNQFYKLTDLEQDGVTYKLLYTREVQRVDKEWTFDLHLDKTKMLSGTMKRTMNIPLEVSGGKLVINEMVITPTQIRIKTSHEKYARFPYMNYYIDVNGTLIKGGENRADPEETSFLFQLPRGLHVTDQTPISFVVKHESLEHRDAKEPILFHDIDEKEKTISTQVGNYSVKWTYYKRDGNFYIQSESADPSFGGINQTHIGKGLNSKVGSQVTVNFSGDGINKSIDVYKNYKEKDAEIFIFWYYTEDPDKEARVELKENAS